MEVKQASSLISKTWVLRFPDFKPSEVLSDDGLYAFAKNIIVVNFEALDALQEFRTKLGKTILVNHGPHRRRGYRSFIENAAVNGETYSYHMQGVAFDLTAPGMTVSELAQAAREFGWKGIGVYKKRNFVHVDLRSRLLGDTVIWEG